MRRLIYLALIVFCAWSSATWAADGGDISDSSVAAYAAESDNYRAGKYVVYQKLLCDGDKDPGNTCAVLDVHANGIPHQVLFRVLATTGCVSSFTVTIEGDNENAGGDPVALGQMTVTGTTANLDMADFAMMAGAPFPWRYISADVSATNTCTDLEVLAVLIYPR